MSRENFKLPISPMDENQVGSPSFSDWDIMMTTAVKTGEDGKLCVDVIETEEELIVVAPMAGTEPEDLELHLQNDLLTIRGQRRNFLPENSEFHHQETFWGGFSRTIVLPVDVRAELTKAEYKYGILTIRLPKAKTQKNIPITVVEE